jgi:hypothetical protein
MPEMHGDGMNALQPPHVEEADKASAPGCRHGLPRRPGSGVVAPSSLRDSDDRLLCRTARRGAPDRVGAGFDQCRVSPNHSVILAVD